MRPDRESAGKKHGYGNKKIGNAHLRWAFGEAAWLFLRQSARGKKWHETCVAVLSREAQGADPA